MPESSNREYYSSARNEFSDVIGKPPGWLLRSGIGMVAIVVLTILGMSYFFKYPDKIIGRGSLTSTTPPIELVSRSEGYIEEILVKQDEIVNEGETILYIHNTTNQEEIERLSVWINAYDSIQANRELQELEFPKDLQVGSLQSEYAELGLKFNELKQQLDNNLTKKRVRNIYSEIKKIKDLNGSRQREKDIYKKELDLMAKDHARNQGLFDEGVISELELENSKSELLSAQREYETMENAIIQNKIRIDQLKMEQLALTDDKEELIKASKLSIAEIISRIRSNMANWTERYSIQSPITGKVSFRQTIQTNKPVNIGQVVGDIVPQSAEGRYLTSAMPATNIGKTEVGQKVLIKFDAYPYKEFGMMEKTVGSISTVPELTSDQQVFYEVKVDLDGPLVTDFGETIKYQAGLTATVEIITEDRSIFERIFDQFISLLKQ